MRNVFKKLARVVTITHRYVGNTVKVGWLRLSQPDLNIGENVRVALSAKIQLDEGGKITLGDRVHISRNVYIRVAKGAELIIGDDGFVGQNSVITAVEQVTIGADALIAENVTIRDQDHGIKANQPYRLQPTEGKPIVIGENVWLGAQVVVLKSVHIGDHCVVGAGSVVTRSLEPSVIAVGNPTRVIRKVGD